ncbi:MAG: hypothetical protein H6713_17705 [Myxococcales bacterium]|nr:hypothetical protein [Myxococcales bacterium]MCB9751813.1 hypothetical protein [Myxococcales bacterium]
MHLHARRQRRLVDALASPATLLLTVSLAGALPLLSACPRGEPRTTDPEPAPAPDNTRAHESATDDEPTTEALPKAVPEARAPDEPDAPDESLRPEPLREPAPDPRTHAGGCDDGRYAVGEQWRDDCNTCVCGPGGKATCTLMACGGGRDTR